MLLLTAGAKGAVGSTLAVTVAALRRHEEAVLPYLTTARMFPYLGSPKSISLVGWDKEKSPLVNCIEHHGVLFPSAKCVRIAAGHSATRRIHVDDCIIGRAGG